MAERQIQMHMVAESSTPDVDMILAESPQKLLEFSENLIDQGYHGLAVIISHVACEITVERVLIKKIEDKGLLKSKTLPDYWSCNIANSRIKKIYIKLTGDNKIEDEGFWEEFEKSVKYRNLAVHQGAILEKKVAEKSLDAAESLIKYLDQKFSMS